MKRYSINPKATVGTPMSALKMPFINHFPLKECKPNTIAIGMPHKQANSVPTPVTYSDL
jgi:hypothetical protein